MLNANNNFYQSMLANKQGFEGEFAIDDNLTPAKLVEKSITENGEYSAKADNADGFSKVTVDVSGGGGETFEVELTMTLEGAITVNKTYVEIKSAIDSGKTIVGNMTVPTGYFPDGSVDIVSTFVSDIFLSGGTTLNDCIVMDFKLLKMVTNATISMTMTVGLASNDDVYIGSNEGFRQVG